MNSVLSQDVRVEPNPMYAAVLSALKRERRTWLITGVAGFIGSNLLEKLLKFDQIVVGFDNFSTGHKRNLDDVKDIVSEAQWNNFSFIQGDIRDIDNCRKIFAGRHIDHVLHQAALGSVPRSIADPLLTNDVNVSGFVNILLASYDARVRSFTYAASSSTYGDHPALPKVEDVIGRPLSPYAVTKYVNEIYADVFAKTYGFKSIGLRYFNVFGKRQDPHGAYAAVIPRWILAITNNEEIAVNGDGETTRDFCYIENVVQANILASYTASDNKNEIYNIAVGEAMSLNDLAHRLISELKSHDVQYTKAVVYKPFRTGDVKHSLANIEKAKCRLGYVPQFTARDGLKLTVEWYIHQNKANNSMAEI